MKFSVPFFKILSRGAALLAIFALLVGSFAPVASAASNGIEVSGWIPYWRTATGTTDASNHISQFSEVNPFGYTVKQDGTLYDAMNLNDPSWQNLFTTARSNGVKIVPTVMWSDTETIDSILRNPTTRATHIASIVSAVTQNKFDGIDIDYEGKKAETRDSYSAFIRELSAALNAANSKAILDCTIEARMPLSARYSGTPPANIEYANDLPVLNQYCDRIRLMTYDQQTADLQLNKAHQNELYAPVADAAWVEKVINYMANEIDTKKIVMGVATYGYSYQAMSNIDGSGFTYTKIEAFNPQYGLDIAKQYNITPTRNSAGELSISYVPNEQASALPSNSTLSALAPGGTASAYLAAAGALIYSKNQSKQAPVQFLTWSDAQAIQDKAVLAKRLGIAGIAIFKIDGGEDPNMWNALSSLIGTPSKTSLTPIRTVTNTITVQASTTPTQTTMQTATTATTTPVKTPVVTTPAPTTSSAFKADLKTGSENADVLRLQKILIAKGFLKVKANGYFGPATLAAVKAWQKSADLPATGFFGPQSRAKIGN